jgi:predicted nucleic acid-binding protein
MPDSPVISNTSPLFYLHQIQQLDLLRQIYGQVIVPPAVVAELKAGAAKGERVPEPENFNWLEISAVPAQTVIKSIPDLGGGEAEVIELAISLPGSLVIIDDQLGRQIAQAHGLRFTGTLGVLIKAKRSGLVPLLRPLLGHLQTAGMWLSPRIILETLRLAGE